MQSARHFDKLPVSHVSRMAGDVTPQFWGNVLRVTKASREPYDFVIIIAPLPKASENIPI